MKKGVFTIFGKTVRLKATVALILSLVLLLGGCGASESVSSGPTEDTTATQQTTQATTDGSAGITDATEDTASGSTQNEQTASGSTQNEQTTSGGTGTQQTTGNQSNNQTTTNNQTSTGNQSGTQPAKGVGKGKASPVSLSSIPAYSGKPYVQVDGGTPNFSAAELTATGYETYSELDSLGRTGVAVASVGKDTMPGDDEERGSISSIKPAGWVQKQYDCVSGRYLYNRCHLIGWQLSAENANKANLMTGTQYLNNKGMLPFENMVADYIKETGNHVAYRVTPIYSGSELVARGVQIEAYSVEDDGDGICFNVFCYNVQPEITIDYATGESTGPASENDSSSTPDTGTEASYILNKNSKKFHHPNCSSVDKMKEENKEYYTGSREELIEKGYDPCGNCEP